jgi:7-cyano-7-deazaguanine tRNA-ribosyltransferase
MYPLGQSIFPPREGLDLEILRNMKEVYSQIDLGEIMEWDGEGKPDFNGDTISGKLSDIRRVLCLARSQFERTGADDPVRSLFGDFSTEEDLVERIVLKKSRKTGKIRNVLINENGVKKHILSMKAEDGMFSIKLEGGIKLHGGTSSPWRRVIVETETGEFNAKGLNVFCRFVRDADPGIRPGDDVLVVDGEDTFLAVGRAQSPGHHLIRSSSGIAVRVREGVLSNNTKDNN